MIEYPSEVRRRDSTATRRRNMLHRTACVYQNYRFPTVRTRWQRPVFLLF